MKRNPSAVIAYLSAFILLCGLSSRSPGETQVVVGNAADRSWKEKVAYDINYVNRFLCEAFTLLPSDVRVFKSFRSPEYDMALATIFVDESYIPVEMFHEYGHKVLDEYLSHYSAAYRYYKLRKTVSGKPLQQAISDLELEIQDDRQYLSELRQKNYQKMAANLGRAIAISNKLLSALKEEVGSEALLSPLYDRYTGESDEPSLYQLIGPYHELFADSLSVLITRSWDAIHMAQADRLQRTDGELSYVAANPQIGLEQFLAYRTFRSGVQLADYPFSQEEAGSNYTQFVPMRSYIRQLAEGEFRERPALLLRLLAEAVVTELDNRLHDPLLYQMGLYEKNQRLYARLTAQIKNQSGVSLSAKSKDCSSYQKKLNAMAGQADAIIERRKSLGPKNSAEKGS